MSQHVIIDGNNLLHAMHAHAPLPHVGRETLVRVVDRWARRGDHKVTLVFDGPPPREGLSKQMTSSRITVRFSAPATADDLIVQVIHERRSADTLRVVTNDKAIRYEAKYRRCHCTDSVNFVEELCPSEGSPRSQETAVDEKPQELSQEDVQQWLDLFQMDDEESPGDFDAM